MESDQRILDRNYIEKATREVVSIYAEADALTVAETHAHPRPQLIYTIAGTIRIEIKEVQQLLPASWAALIPAGAPHAFAIEGKAKVVMIYINETEVTARTDRSQPFFVEPLLREVILRLAGLPKRKPLDDLFRNDLLLILCHEIDTIQDDPYHLPIPSEPRLRRITEALVENPLRYDTVEGWGALVGVSARKLNSLFQQEIGYSFSKYRQRVHVRQAVGELQNGKKVATVAYGLGYDSPSAFIAMFKRTTGWTPLTHPMVRRSETMDIDSLVERIQAVRWIAT